MANEISISGSLSLNNTNIDIDKNFSLATITQSTENYVAHTQTIGFAAEEPLILGDITTPGYCIFHNADATNYVTIGETTNNDIIKLKAGEWCLVRLGVTAPYAIANTASVKLEYIILED